MQNNDDEFLPTKRARQIAGLLAGFGIKPSNQRIGDAQAKGYALSDFADTLERYVSRPRGDSSVPSVPDNNINDLGLDLSVPTETAGTDRNDEKPPINKAWDAGTAKNPLPSKTKGAAATGGPRTPRVSDDSRLYGIHRNPEDRRPPPICSGPDDDLNDFV
jgi:hypothetical protein